MQRRIVPNSGVPCPKCGCTDSAVHNSRSRVVAGHEVRMRTRECACGNRYNTSEITEASFKLLVARDERLASAVDALLSVRGAI